MKTMEQSPEESERSPQGERAFAEAAERERRLQAWLGGVLSAGSSPAAGQKEWRQGLEMYDGSDPNSAKDPESLPEALPKRVEDSLLKCRLRIRERRESAGTPPLEIDDDVRESRAARVVEAIRIDRATGTEPTPLHLVLAARYIEGEMDLEQYSSAVRDL